MARKGTKQDLTAEFMGSVDSITTSLAQLRGITGLIRSQAELSDSFDTYLNKHELASVGWLIDDMLDKIDTAASSLHKFICQHVPEAA